MNNDLLVKLAAIGLQHLQEEEAMMKHAAFEQDMLMGKSAALSRGLLKRFFPTAKYHVGVGEGLKLLNQAVDMARLGIKSNNAGLLGTKDYITRLSRSIGDVKNYPDLHKLFTKQRRELVKQALNYKHGGALPKQQLFQEIADSLRKNRKSIYNGYNANIGNGKSLLL